MPKLALVAVLVHVVDAVAMPDAGRTGEMKIVLTNPPVAQVEVGNLDPALVRTLGQKIDQRLFAHEPERVVAIGQGQTLLNEGRNFLGSRKGQIAREIKDLEVALLTLGIPPLLGIPRHHAAKALPGVLQQAASLLDKEERLVDRPAKIRVGEDRLQALPSAHHPDLGHFGHAL